VKVEDLIALADKVLSASGSTAETTELVADYTAAFSAWYETGPTKNIKPGAAEEGVLFELADKHEKVLALAKTILKGTSGELRAFKSRAKGLMVYADVLPKRVSTRRVKKG